MPDNITIALNIRTKKFKPKKLLPNGTAITIKRTARVRVYDPSGGDLHVHRNKLGTKLIIEGSFIKFLQGNNVICPMDILPIVQEAVKRVLKKLGIKPTKEEQARIDKGHIKLDRLDIVGWLKSSDITPTPSQTIAALDFGLAGSDSKRMIAGRQTLVWHSFSKYWTLMFYDKAVQMKRKFPDVWDSLPEAVKDICRNHVRVELRILRKGLRELGWNEVGQVTEAMMREELEKRYAACLEDLRTPLPPIPIYGHKPSKPLLLALLKTLGVDMLTGMDERPRRRYTKLIKEELGVLSRHHAGLPRAYRKQISCLKKVPLRVGIPHPLRKKGLVYIPQGTSAALTKRGG